MLQKIREHIGGWVAAIMFGFLALAFAVWGIQYDFTAQPYAAKVNGEKIPVERLQQAYQTQLNQIQQYYGTDLPEPLIAQLRDSVLESEIRASLLRQRAETLGYRVGDDAVIESIRQAPEFQVGGEFSEQTYRGFLAGRGLSPRGFEEEQRVRLRLLQLQNAIAATAFTTPHELERYTALEDERREVAWLRIPAERFLAPAQITDEAIAAYYASHQAEFMTPESVSLQYIELRREDLADDVQVEEAALHAYYQDVVATRYTVEEERKASHILIAAAREDDAEARAEAEQIKAQLDGGEEFARLAREHSDDAGSAARGGELDWAGRGVFVGPFETAVFEMEKGEIRGPVETRFGFHIIRLDDVRAGSTRSFEEVREELEAEYRQQQAEELFRENAEQLADEAFTSFNELESVAARLGVELKTLEDFSRLGGGGFGAAPRVIDAVFSEEVLEQRQNSALVEIDDGHVAVFRVTAHRPPEQRPLEAVSQEIRHQLARLAAEQAARDAGSRILERLRRGEALAALAAEHELELPAPGEVGRDHAELPPTLLATLFRATAPAAGQAADEGLSLPGGDYAIYRLTAVRPGEVRRLRPEETTLRRRQLAAEEGRSDFNGYLEELRRSADVTKPQGVFEPLEP